MEWFTVSDDGFVYPNPTTATELVVKRAREGQVCFVTSTGNSGNVYSICNFATQNLNPITGTPNNEWVLICFKGNELVTAPTIHTSLEAAQSWAYGFEAAWNI